MIDWLNVEDVRADKAALEANPCCEVCLMLWPQTVGIRVLEALAERDREIAEWAKAHRQETGNGGDVVDYDELLAYLEAGG